MIAYTCTRCQITPSTNVEINKITLPSRHRIRNSSPGGLRPSTLPLSHGGSSAPHNTYEWSLRVSGKKRFVSLKTECQSRGRTRDLPSFQADRFITTASAPPPPLPKLLQLGVYWFQREIIKNFDRKKIKKNKRISCCSQMLSEAMGSVLILITSYDVCAILDFQIH